VEDVFELGMISEAEERDVRWLKTVISIYAVGIIRDD
jgi:hypothetical protein